MIAIPRQPDMRQLLGKARFSPLMLIILAGLLALVVGCAAFAAYAVLGPDSDEPVSASIDWKAPRPSSDDLDAPPLASSDTQILTRPIFSKNRRPEKASAKPAQANPVSDTPTGLKVSAIVKRRHESQAFVSGSNGKGNWKTVGEKVDDWTISEIEPERLVVSNGVSTARLELYSDKPAPDSPPGQAGQAVQQPPQTSEEYVEPAELQDPAEAQIEKDAAERPPGAAPPPQPPQPPPLDPQEMRRNMRK